MKLITLLRDKKLIKVDVSEDEEVLILATKTKSLIRTAVADCIYKLIKYDDNTWAFKMIQTPWRDKSGLGDYYNSESFTSKGEAIKKIRSHSYSVTLDDKII